MNINKHLILLFSVLFFLFAVSVSSGCFRKNESDVKSVVRNELDQLKNLDSETTQKYIPYTELFPDATENTDLTDEINKTFSLFFRKFNYKISDVIVGTTNHSATVSVKLTTIDSKVLARDFKAELLRTQITESAQAQKGNIKDSSRSLEAHYLILNHLLNTNDYDTAETDCNIQLVNTGNDKKEKWKIQRTNSLEDDLVGGLIADLADPDILSPEDTLSIYLDTLKQMDLTQISSYLGVVSIMNTSDAAKNSIGSQMPAKSLELQHTIRLIRELDREIDEIEEQIQSIMDELHSPITTIPGLGFRMAAMILAEVGDFTRFDSPDKLLAYAGMSPSTYQSGQLKNCYPHMEKRGSRYLRYALYNATKYVCHWNPTFAAYLAKKRAEGKHYNVALSHAAKKLVRLIFAMEKSRQPYCSAA